jgi:EAL domain-containing protein (putative c-di-GMP-specific phosphodiesterase class I)
MLFQPVVDLGSGATVGYEALARGPEGSSVERPDRLFMAARSLGLLAELDWACRLAAGQQAAERGLRQPALLFVNIEPAVLGTPIPSGTVDELRRRAEEQSIVVEFTERDLLLHPARVLRSAEQMRRMGLRLALDDVGADPVSATFLPVLRPDVVKLDMQLVRAEPTPETARTLQSVRAYVEDSGAILLAEGIETDTHLERALAMGATLGQGYRFGRPAPLPAELPRPRTAPIPRMTDPAAAADTPFDLVARWESLRTSRKPLLVELSKGLERFAIQAADDVLLLAAFQQSPQFTPHTMQRYEALADRLPLVAALGAGLPKEPATGVRGVDLVGDDRMVNEWTVVVLGNHVAAALIAVDLEQDAAGEDQRRFQHVLTHDRATVTAAARCMLRRLDPA